MGQLPFMQMLPHSDWVATPVSEMPQDWSQIKRISLDVETKDPDLHELGCGARRPGCHVVGFGVGLDCGPGDKRAYYLPVRHEEGGNLPLEGVRAYLDDNLKHYKGRVTGAELSYDGDYMMQEGIRFPKDVSLFDVLTNDALVDENHEDGYGLDTVSKRHGLEGKDERVLKAAASFFSAGNAKGVLYRLHSKHVGPYACRDVLEPLLIDDKQAPIIEEQGLGRAVQLEADVLTVTIHMRRLGIRIDTAALDSVERWANAMQYARLAQFTHATGINVTMEDLRSSGAMSSIIARLGLPPLPTKMRWNKKKRAMEESAPLIDADTLKAYRDPRVDTLSEAKKLDKILTTYVPSILRYMVNGRVHGTLKSVRGNRDGEEDSSGDQSGTVSRRFAHVHPNLGNQPNPTRDEDDALRVEMGVRWRKIFVAEEGENWGLADFSQQEPRHIINDAEQMAKGGLPGARAMAEAFRKDPRTDNHKMISQLTGLPRGPAKIVFLARCYGAGMPKIAMQLEDKMRQLHPELGPDWRPVIDDFYKATDRWIPDHACVGDPYKRASPECEELIKQFDSYAPYVKQWARMLSDRANERGYILLIDGGRARFRKYENGKYKETHKAGNRRAQGNGAVQLKLAIVALYRAGLMPWMTVHDDVSKSVPRGEEGSRQLMQIKKICEDVIPYITPEEWSNYKGHYKSRVPFLVKVKRGDSYGTADSAQDISEAA